jgi:hypothetical protein
LLKKQVFADLFRRDFAKRRSEMAKVRERRRESGTPNFFFLSFLLFSNLASLLSAKSLFALRVCG